MNAEIKVELSPRQQELILRGLRFVRSSVALDMVDHTTEVAESRRRQYEELDELRQLLAGSESRSAASV
ncbi:MAG: hypothetical protein R3B90_19340 [Planctomycetaceae bacterium]